MVSKTIDHLKTMVSDDKAYLTNFEVPIYIVEKVEQREVSSHLLDYYFCALNGLLKSLSCYDLLPPFKRNFERICGFLEAANDKLLKGKGVILRLELIVKKTLEKRNKMDIIPVFLHPSEVRDGAINFIYKLCNTQNKDVSYSLRLVVEKQKSNQPTKPDQVRSSALSPSKKKNKIFGFLYRRNSSLSQNSLASYPDSDVDNEKERENASPVRADFETLVHRTTVENSTPKPSPNKIIAIKDSYINELMR